MDRIALVIGNSDYSNVGKLNNPKNDADDIASILNKLNFDVTKIMDANLIDIQKSVNDFSVAYGLPHKFGVNHIFFLCKRLQYFAANKSRFAVC